MEDVLQNQADKLADEVEAKLDEILEEQPLPVTLLEEEEKMRIDPEVVEFTRLAVGEVYQLMWDIARPNTLNDLTLMTRVEDATQMLKDIIDHLPDWAIRRFFCRPCFLISKGSQQCLDAPHV